MPPAPRPRALALLICAASLALPAAAPAQSLPSLFEQAQHYDASLQAARANLQAAQARADQARAGLLPHIGLQANAQRSHLDSQIAGQDLTRSYSAYGGALIASQPLYRPANAIARQQGLLGAEAAQAQLNAAEQDLILRLAQTYFDTLAAQDTLHFVRALQTATTQQQQAAQRNFDAGTTTITDSREAQARLDLVRAQEIAAENELRTQQLALAQLVGQPGVQPLPLPQPITVPQPQPEDMESWVQQAQSQHPSLQQTRRALDIAQLETAKARTGHLPTLDLQASLSHNRYPQGNPSSPPPATLNDTRLRNASLGLSLNWPLYAGHAVENRIRETLALEEKARAEHENAQRQIAQATRSAYLALQSLRSQTQALQAAEESSRTALQANQLGYEVGVRINIDVLNAQTQLFQTQRDLARARYNAILALLRLKQVSGQLTPQDLHLP